MNKQFRSVAAFLAILALLAFYIFSREVKRGFLKQADFNSTVVLQNHVPARLDGVWDLITLPVTPTPSMFVVGFLTIAAFIDWKNKKLRIRALIIPVLFALLVMGELYGKSVVHHPSPPFFMIKHPSTIFPQFYVNEQYSYPSGHTARAAFLGVVLFTLLTGPIVKWMANRKKTLMTAVIIFAYVIAVAVSRIYLGEHWMSDVIGGFLLGGGFGVAAAAFL